MNMSLAFGVFFVLGFGCGAAYAYYFMRPTKSNQVSAAKKAVNSLLKETKQKVK